MSNYRQVRVTLVKSPIGYTQDQRRTVQALGLNKLNASRVHVETPQIRGMINKVIHLLHVEEVDQ
ncbi:MAG: 50S ribosomal protein L30 [Phototrophicales bacterium]|nr:MAG: 50S ribosomal protein L30 [Phototrophicales bacterium]RMG70105.1 MAG: 50S ribosomal protein L30 [Chloroflexota bacterium]